MVLDHSGPNLAMILYAGALKLALFGSLVVRVVIGGVDLAAPASLAILLVGLVAYAALVGVVESGMARLRMNRVPQLLVTACAIAGFGLILLLR
jgi:formate hydrogenlyase subunit 4